MSDIANSRKSCGVLFPSFNSQTMLVVCLLSASPHTTILDGEPYGQSVPYCHTRCTDVRGTMSSAREGVPGGRGSENIQKPCISWRIFPFLSLATHAAARDTGLHAAVQVNGLNNKRICRGSGQGCREEHAGDGTSSARAKTYEIRALALELRLRRNTLPRPDKTESTVGAG